MICCLIKVFGDISVSILKGTFDLAQYNFADNVFPDYFTYTGNLSLQMPLFNGFYYRNKIREAEAALKLAKANFKAFQDQVFNEVVTYYNDYKNSLNTHIFTTKYLAAAQEEFRVMLASYKAGTVDILNVLTAQTSLSNARAQNIQTKKDIFVALTNLAYATGSLTFPQMFPEWQNLNTLNSEDIR